MGKRHDDSEKSKPSEAEEGGNTSHDGSTGDSISAENARWSFSGEVHQTFDQHISRSVPAYEMGHDLIAKVSDYFIGDDSLCYEIGCSTGTLTRMLAERNKGKSVRLIGLDSVPEMVEAGRAKCAGYESVEIREADILDFDFEPADLIVSYYTIQFVRPRHRQELFDRIYKSLNWGGAFLLFEKVRAPDARFQDMTTALYTDFKLDQGFNEAEIVNKTRSLKGILEPFSTAGNLGMLERSGFVDIMSIFKYVCFEGFLAIK
jgi:tRNA (cmo5U34)-methyltransferase